MNNVNDSLGIIDQRQSYYESAIDRAGGCAATRHRHSYPAINGSPARTAHDLNNILTVMLCCIETIRDYEANPSKRSIYLQKSLDAGARAKELIATMIKPETLKRKEFTRIQLAILEVAQFLKVSLPTTIDVKTEISLDCGIVNIPRVHLHRLIMNLGMNAGQAISSNSGTITIGLEQVWINDAPGNSIESHNNRSKLAPGLYAKLSVSDTGHGIAKEDRNEIFRPYFTTKKRFGGTGLGLANIRDITYVYGGEITLESDKHGTEFNVYLPIG